ncbi:hypothetical protein HMPREF7215_1382 [Pyramidobacter piscolens W5455]|uniref:Uncharacterized protein n=1 Tax=Pyramidobacter piscolens W5455 TaxID=352165 RepID=A0ABM9ZY66_9BACT|nr:hypothetical protein HMPREF7215_1382 [Pyramidobacter piscolens W5455]
MRTKAKNEASRLSSRVKILRNHMIFRKETFPFTWCIPVVEFSWLIKTN